MIKQSIEIDRQHRSISNIVVRIQLSESNSVALIESLSKWSKDSVEFNNQLMERVKAADNELDKKIENLAAYNSVVTEGLRTISEAQNAIVKAIIGLSMTNTAAVDIP